MIKLLELTFVACSKFLFGSQKSPSIRGAINLLSNLISLGLSSLMFLILWPNLLTIFCGNYTRTFSIPGSHRRIYLPDLQEWFVLVDTFLVSYKCLSQCSSKSKFWLWITYFDLWLWLIYFDFDFDFDCSTLSKQRSKFFDFLWLFFFFFFSKSLKHDWRQPGWSNILPLQKLC
jgi:hypothetical protein